ncbi:hypothetical protein GGF32_008613 [Allomyces javanicus]|nr:hypothetical protein GGF32_008613 [Allomyces javanicus]
MTGSVTAEVDAADPDHPGRPMQPRATMSAHPARTAVARPVPHLPEVQVNGVTAPSAEYWPAHLDNDPDVGPASPQWHAAPGDTVPPIQQGRRDGATSLVDLAEREIERDGDVRLTSVPFPDSENYADELPPVDAQERQQQGADKAGSTRAASPLRAQLSSDRPTAKPVTEEPPKTAESRPHGKSPCAVPMVTDPRKCGYLPIENYGIIGNMRTAALIGTDASIDFMCFPRFDSPSVFCRLLDHRKGGYFQIVPKQQASRKQQYLPNSNVLVTRFLADEGASQVTDFFHLPEKDSAPTSGSANVPGQPAPGAADYGANHHTNQGHVLYPWVIRIVEAVRGTVTFDALCFPAFRYALDAHTTHIEPGCDESDEEDDDIDDLERDRTTVGSRDEIMCARTINATVVFTSPTLTMDLRHVVMNPCCDDATGMAPLPRIRWETEEREELKGPGVKATFTLHQGQQLWFVFRERPKVHEDGDVASAAHATAAASASAMPDNVTRPASPALAAPVVTKLWSAHPAPCDTNGSAGDVAANANNRVTGPLGCGLDPAMNRPLSPFPLDMHSVLRSDSDSESPNGAAHRRSATESSSGSSGGRSRTTTGGPGDCTATAQLCTSCANGPSMTTTVNDVRNVRARTESAGSLRKIKVEVVAGFDPESGPGTPLTSSTSPLPSTTRSSHHREHADRTRIRQQRRLRDLLDPPLTVEFLQMLLRHTLRYWHTWISQSTYTGRWRESVQRSAFTLKLMTYQPTGAVIAAPTFSLPEEIGGDRNWDYRYVWLRDSAFTIYAFIRLGLLSEARNYMRFVEMVFKDGGPPRVMYTIDGATEMPELELTHLDGYRGSKPVRIGNAASNHLQLDISGALLDAIYLMNKFSSPIGYDMWVVCAKLVDFVVENWQQPDMSIWEVRGKPVNFLYSKVMSWVAVDRGLRLVEKRMFPCPNRDQWFRTRDAIYLEIMEKGWNHEGRFFQQAYENAVLDSSVLIMPLVFFMSPTDPRLLSTIAAILRAPERGGLTVNNLVRRYQVGQVDDGFESDEGAFTMCTLWLVEALTRAGQYYPKYLARALYAFDQTLAYGNHLLLFSEQVSPSGELVGNFPQAFTHIALISSAFNLDRVLGHRSVPDIV